jgi:two-component system cell cycle sensor histidine kinase/response regulator CckA
VIKGACRARDLVKYILTCARQGQQTNVALQPHLIVKESLKLLRASIPTTTEIRQEIDAQCGMIIADPSQLHQVMMNLCTNAWQAMENAKGTLYVCLRKKYLTAGELVGQPGISPRPFVELTVSNTDHGMDQQTMARIFEPYFTTKP